VAVHLRPAVQLAGEPPLRFTLEERMAHHRVPGVSVAVLDDGEIAWARGWGVADTETGRPVEVTTLFQAASISKPVAALVAMGLVDEGRLFLDGPANRHLTSWKVPESDAAADSVVRLRGLLSHTAGLTVSGFPGYRKDESFGSGRPVAANADVLDGRGNTPPVRVHRVPGTGWRYSGGGYTVMEQMVEDVTGRPFAEAAAARVLGPAGMARSTFAQPLPTSRWNEASRGHLRDGSEVPGEWHTYPEQAAAGLWTTPTDLLQLSRHLLAVRSGGETDGIVAPGTLALMLTPHRAGEEGFNAYGLGFNVGGAGPGFTFGHGGSNAGFKSQWVVYAESGDGAVVMTNGDRGRALANEILRAIAHVHEWPGFRPRTRAAADPDREALAAYAGRYELAGAGVAVVVEVGDGVLRAAQNDGPSFTLHAAVEAEDTFFDAVDGQEIVFRRGPEGRVVSLVVDGRTVLTRTGG
jgi:CubicO group peptidase (beta-lactamase class C family)